ncbi:MAG: lambda exonuclease family protein [Pseudomonadota bacterium]
MHSMDQGSAEWFAARLGKATASKIADIIAKTKSGVSASRATYAGQLIAERLSGTPTESFSNGSMQWGTDNEAAARDAYAAHHLCEVVEVGFADHPTIPMSGASPDGLVGDDGLVEIKCPNSATHIDTLLKKAIPSKYVTQMMWQMACTGRKWCDFASFDPRLPEHMQLIVIRLDRSDEWISEIEAEVAKFLSEIDDKVAALREQYEPQREAA